MVHLRIVPIASFAPIISDVMQMRKNILRVSIAFIFLVFGGLKFFPELSPAEVIGGDTVQKLTYSLIPKHICINALAAFEITIGLGLLCNRFIKITVLLAVVHLIFTFTPFIIYPGEVFNLSANSLSLLGQYILKNIIIISALLMIYPFATNYQTVIISK